VCLFLPFPQGLCIHTRHRQKTSTWHSFGSSGSDSTNLRTITELVTCTLDSQEWESTENSTMMGANFPKIWQK
jgi:hypothetical protein